MNYKRKVTLKQVSRILTAYLIDENNSGHALLFIPLEESENNKYISRPFFMNGDRENFSNDGIYIPSKLNFINVNDNPFIEKKKLNRLKNKPVYLVGCMDLVKDGGVGWRNDLTPWLENRNIIVWNPTDKPIENRGLEDAAVREEINKMKNNGEYGEIRKKYKDIRNIDLRMVDESKFIIANISIKNHACGTYEELFWANRCKKPVLVHIEEGKKNCPNWLLFTLPHELIFDNWDDLKEYVRHIDEDEIIDDLRRWVFFTK